MKEGKRKRGEKKRERKENKTSELGQLTAMYSL